MYSDCFPKRYRVKFRKPNLYVSERDGYAVKTDYMADPSARKTCVMCGAAPFHLHHPVYQGIPAGTLSIHLVPLCPRHHRDFEFNVWPALRQAGLTRQGATLAYVVHGERLHLLLKAARSGEGFRVDVAPTQLQLPIESNDA